MQIYLTIGNTVNISWKHHMIPKGLHVQSKEFTIFFFLSKYSILKTNTNNYVK